MWEKASIEDPTKEKRRRPTDPRILTTDLDHGVAVSVDAELVDLNYRSTVLQVASLSVASRPELVQLAPKLELVQIASMSELVKLALM